MQSIKQHINIAAVSIVAMFFFTTACKNDVGEVLEATNITKLPERVQYGIHYVYTDSARKSLEIKSPEVIDFTDRKDPFREFPLGIDVTFFTADGTPDANLRSNYAKQFEKQKMWEARGDVVVVNSKGEQLNTEQLFWDTKKKMIYSDKFVKVISDGTEFQGYGFESDEEFKSWKILEFEGSIDVEEDEDSDSDLLNSDDESDEFEEFEEFEDF